MSQSVHFTTAAEYDLQIAQFDVKTAFLYDELREEIYMNVPKSQAYTSMV